MFDILSAKVPDLESAYSVRIASFAQWLVLAHSTGIEFVFRIQKDLNRWELFKSFCVVNQPFWSCVAFVIYVIEEIILTLTYSIITFSRLQECQSYFRENTSNKNFGRFICRFRRLGSFNSRYSHSAPNRWKCGWCAFDVTCKDIE